VAYIGNWSNAESFRKKLTTGFMVLSYQINVNAVKKMK
jgi:hypothetical protein